ncbi:hypothetical protein COS64_04655 [archaeon CG06_land_8_20_14_3_00_37_11]|nr:MAG: hypothetical protein COS64_04655 [archaeon CG06_land_8_20_14_3_00_37_11]
MNVEKHEETLKEVMATIEDALNSEDIRMHQRRLIAMISLGVQQIIEYYFHKLDIIKPGAQIKHNWFAVSLEKIQIKLESILTRKLDKIKNLDELLVLARRIEEGRNDLVYGSPVKSDKILREKINLFLKIRELIEDEIK